ncbi:flagellar motor protein MotB [Taibaiella sp. KBW10]|uniref:OmpA family protein n=1 Tax=Taibaiella sp. KBW10 TaxID=2153357 RepID=UPI000F5AB0CE|nr:OmpA family protein [Taibaiella sp. KBW10]RQO29996.1 flagellar motor protein MotB [Taibaiella sp. KBW10]
MKQVVLSCLLLAGSLSPAWSQEAAPVKTAVQQMPLQVTLFGGLSIPTGTYRDLPGRAQNGLNLGLSGDYFFTKHWGLGIDARYQQHKMKPFITDLNAAGSYNFTFLDGTSQFIQSDRTSFSHIGISLGPIYRTSAGTFDFNVFARIGALMQQYPEYRQSISALNPLNNQTVHLIDPFYTDNASSKPVSLMGLAGASVVYNISPNFALVLQADYLSSLGENGKFKTSEHEKINNLAEGGSIKFREDPENPGTYTNNLGDYYSDKVVTKSTLITNLNLSLGLRLKFGNESGGRKGNRGSNKEGKETIVVVKDKKTGMALGGVKVEIKGDKGTTYVGLTDANGMINTKLASNDYTITGDKNGVATTSNNIAKADFQNNNVYKELLHDDERFTLVGETVDCKTGRKISGINAMLTQTGKGSTLSQISDQNGKFAFQLDAGADYNLVANEDGKFSQTELVTTKGLDRSKTVFVTLKLGVCDLKEGEAFVVKNIFYDFDAANIRPDAALVLNNIVMVMKNNPKMTIELSSHTDSRGDKNYNNTLSQQRAESAVNYLVSKGIARKRLVAKGYGEARLVNGCKDGVSCTEQEHEQNRRTEIKILKY